MTFVKKETKFKVGGVEINLGQKYVLDHKFDGGAPDGLKKIEATKFPFTGSGVQDCVAFDESRNMYDTGFYEHSLCLSHYTAEEKKALVPIYEKQIKKPFEQLRNEDLSASSNNEFWKRYRYEAYVNKEFDTNNPNDLFDLFLIITQGVACDKNEKNPFYRKPAQFIISNPHITKNKNKERSKTRLKAINFLSTLAQGDKDKLDLILNYVGREATHKVSAEDLQLIYFEVINDPKSGLDFAERFIEAIEEYETPVGKDKMEYFHAIGELVKLRKIKKEKGRFNTDQGVFLGNTLQDIAKFCLNQSSTQAKVIQELIEQNPSVRREI